MIFYFSATGNSKHVAEAIARATNDETIDIAECLDEERSNFDASGGQVSFVAPVFFWGLPSIVVRFLSHLDVKKPGYTFYVTTFGTTSGASGHMAQDLLEERGIRLDAQYCVRMPDSWTPLFDLSDPEAVAAINDQAEEQIADVVEMIAAHTERARMEPRLPLPIARIGYATYGRQARTKHLTVGGTCIGCDTCAKKCPVHAIAMRGKRPVWTADKCAMCLGCLHRCPKFAIQYGGRTKYHGQYRNPHTDI